MGKESGIGYLLDEIGCVGLYLYRLSPSLLFPLSDTFQAPSLCSAINENKGDGRRYRCLQWYGEAEQCQDPQVPHGSSALVVLCNRWEGVSMVHVIIPHPENGPLGGSLQIMSIWLNT